MRVLLILILLVIVYWWARRALDERRRRNKPMRRPVKGERMLACAHCGLHVPESEALKAEGRFYCSEQHRRLGVQKER
ncbi:MAG TPA: PP0621 family protein [Azoarcus sp.]|nr:PP0621 family protein [Azoarcus sp.]